jgi:ABC-type transport system involved in cytochrome c biogenesis permease subunit
MVIQQRPPVTNLYSSAIFIGWGCAGLLILLEWWYRNGIGVLLAGATGATSLVIAHYLSLSGDTLEMMQAVLDTNFWLATHVTTVTLGYTASFVAGFLGVLYILRGVVTPTLTVAAGKTISTMTYGVICFAMLLSFVGTVLGGIWADQSWGRFWGWDPKENGAVLIVIWNALILHARWAGIVKQRGMAVLAVFGNIVTAWSWFGTNQLGVGLHSYGFTSGVSKWLAIFWAAMLLVMAIGMMPERWWWSHQSAAAPGRRPRSEPLRRQPAPIA